MSLYITKTGDINDTKKLTVSEIFGPTQKVKWKSSDTSVATVKAGKVTSVKKGTCYITASTKDAVSEKCKITVKYAPEYTITYYLDGGKNSKKNPAKYTPTTPIITLENSTREGYVFAGWKDENNVQIKEIKKGSKGNLTLFATWRSGIIAPVDLGLGQWRAIAYPGHWITNPPESFQFYATDWNCNYPTWDADANQNVYAIADLDQVVLLSHDYRSLANICIDSVALFGYNIYRI